MPHGSMHETDETEGTQRIQTSNWKHAQESNTIQEDQLNGLVFSIKKKQFTIHSRDTASQNEL